MEPQEIRIECDGSFTVSIDELNELHRFKTMTDQHYAELRNSITELGFSFPYFIWIDSEGKQWIVDAHQRTRALKRMREEGFIIPALPAIRIFAKDKKEAAKKVIAAESRYADPNEGDFAEFLDSYDIGIEEVDSFMDIPDIDSTMWDIPPGQEDEPPAVDETQTISQLGQVYKLGRHRLMCGDATKIEDIEKLMGGKKADLYLSDPPYGVSYTEKNEFLNSIGKPIATPNAIENDSKTPEQMYDFWLRVFTNVVYSLSDKASYYIFSPQGADLLLLLLQAVRDSGLQLKHVLVWAKNNHVLGRADYNYQHEPIVYGWKQNGTHDFYGKGQFLTSLWQYDKPLKNDLHPTMKPVGLLTNAILNSSKDEDILLDNFGGSGSTLIACEQTNRICYMMEIDPRYCDVIRKRYAKVAGQEENWQELTPVIQ